MKMYDEIIKEFLSTDLLREALMESALIEEYVFASNGHISIKIPIDKLAGTYRVNPDYPDIVTLFDKRDGLFDKPKIYSVESIEKVLSGILRVPIEIGCPNCEGTGLTPVKGTSEDETQWDNCPKCKGQGDLFSQEKEYAWKTHKFQIDNAYFNPNYIEKLVVVAKINDLKQVEHFAGLPEGQNHFKIDGIEILIKPMRINDEAGNPGYYTYHKLEEETV
jgi:hypothetical protein